MQAKSKNSKICRVKQIYIVKMNSIQTIVGYRPIVYQCFEINIDFVWIIQPIYGMDLGRNWNPRFQESFFPAIQDSLPAFGSNIWSPFLACSIISNLLKQPFHMQTIIVAFQYTCAQRTEYSFPGLDVNVYSVF